MLRLFFCFVHIPKCGGLTFDDILARNLGHGYLRLSSQLYEGAVATRNLALFIAESADRVGIGGHRVSLGLPDVEDVDLKAISFVRDPIERIRSEFFYVRQLPGEVGQNHVIRSLDYPSYLEYFLTHSEALEKIGSYQTRRLFGNMAYSEEYLTEVVLQKKLLLFPLKRFDDACVYLEKVFPDYFKDASFVKKNVNSCQDNARYTELEETLRSKLMKDNALYSLANRQFETNLIAEFSEDTLMRVRRTFRRRCWMRKYTYHPLQYFTSKLYRVAAKW